MGGWVKTIVRGAQVDGWEYALDPGATSANTSTNIQDLMLHVAGNEGAGICGPISVPNCGSTGYSHDLCLKYPEAHFAIWTINNFANWLSIVQHRLTDSAVSVGFSTNDFVKAFFTPTQNPSQLIVPVSIIGGIAAIVSSVTPVGAVIAGIAGIVNGILTQEGLNRPDPLKQWGEVQTAVGQIFTQASDGIGKFYDASLDHWPDYPDTGHRIDEDPSQLPMILAGGSFAALPQIPPTITNTGIQNALAASAINALWAADHVFIMKLTDQAYGRGDGAACNGRPVMTVCKDGAAYIFARWVTTSSGARVTRVINPFDTASWNVWGAYKQGTGPDGSTNDNMLSKYGLDLSKILDSVLKTAALAKGQYPFDNQNGALLDYLQSNPSDVSPAALSFWNLPVCDMEAAIGPGLHLPTQGFFLDVISNWGPCTCMQDSNWPKDLYSLPPLSTTTTQCRKVYQNY
ncbi:uncharacterized protein KY384_008027 [Bacidia gigantensis]|uniref:uncharacterized protein n=1 Tax=Bacidia gigantensis TaxID=2732470 RepID=UPI001D0457CF|nr:uncharacterized protein KY384_008027 [Bacidia gigantensis]KAG8527283.1 hypothetical protein KY384_008027 [Bacidia gigantensis]